MQKTVFEAADNPITVDIEGLCSLLSCGHCTARRIAEDAEAVIRINRRVLFSVAKVKEYVEDMAS